MNETMEYTENIIEEKEAIKPDKKQIRAHFSKLGIMMFCGTLIIMLVQGICLGAAKVLIPNLQENYNIYFAVQMLPLYVIGYPIMFLLVKQVKGVRITEHEMTGGQLVIAFTMAYALMILGNLLGLGITGIIGILKGGEVVNPLVNIATSGNIWLNAVYTVLLAPVFEEYLFRKLIVDRTIRYGEGMAVVVSGMFFALFHGNLNQFVYALPLGLFFAFIYAKTGRMRYTVILHMAVNFMGTIVGLLPAEVFEEGSAAQVIASMVCSVVITAVVVTGVVFLFRSWKKMRCNAGEIVLEKGTRFKTAALNVGVILYAGFWILNMIIMLLV